MDKNCYHTWPRGETFLLALPNLDNSFTANFVFPDNDKFWTEKVPQNPQLAKEFFEKAFPDALKAMPNFMEEFTTNPNTNLIYLKCSPWIRGDKFALIGDSCHAMGPFYAHGMNTGFEDCKVLNDLLDEHGEDWETVLKLYESCRKPDGDAVTDMTVEYFHLLTDPKQWPLLQLEYDLFTKFPEKFVSQFQLASFYPEVRYSVARTIGQHHDKVIAEMLQQQLINPVENFLEQVIIKLSL